MAVFRFLSIGLIIMCNSCQAAFVDTLTKCSIKDGNCQRDLYQYVLQSIGKTGIPDLGIPPIDPLEVKNLTVSVVDLMEFNLIDGYVRGIRDCVVNRFETTIEKEFATMDLTCDVSIKGIYTATMSGSLAKSFFANSENVVHGDGHVKAKFAQKLATAAHIGLAKVTLKRKPWKISPYLHTLSRQIGEDKIHITFDFFFFAQRQADGEIYLKCKNTEMKYRYEILGDAAFTLDNIYLWGSDVSQLVSGYLNANWKMLMADFGKPFMDKAMDLVYVYTHKFYDVVPAKYYIIEDLSPYAKP